MFDLVLDQPASFAVHLRQSGGILTVTLIGELDLAGGVCLASEMARLAWRPRAALPPVFDEAVVDLRQLQFIDVAGVRALDRACAELQALGARVEVVPGPPRVNRVLTFLRDPEAGAALFDRDLVAGS